MTSPHQLAVRWVGRGARGGVEGERHAVGGSRLLPSRLALADERFSRVCPVREGGCVGPLRHRIPFILVLEVVWDVPLL